MKLKDLPKNQTIDSVCLAVPKDALQKFINYAGGEPKMYAVGSVMGYGFMMSPDPPSSSNRRLFPLPPEVSPSDLLEWDIQ